MGNTLVSLAVLKANWDHARRDHIDNFLPFIATLSISKGYGVIDAQQLCRDFEAAFGFRVSHQAMITIINRARKRGLFKRHRHQHFPVNDELTKLDFSKRFDGEVKAIEDVLAQFVKYAQDHHDVQMNRDDGESALVHFLKNSDLDLLFAADAGSSLPDTPRTQSARRSEYLLCAFVRHASENKLPVFTTLVDIATGHILAGTLLYGRDTPFSAGLRGSQLFFDTGFLLFSLGLEGPERESQALQLIAMLSRQGAKLAVFDYTLGELSGVLENCMEWVEKSDYDPSRAQPALRYMRENGYSASDVERVLVNLKTHLHNLRVETAAHPNPRNQEFQIDETRLRALINEEYGSLGSGGERTQLVDHDVNVISSIYRLRKANYGRTMRDAGATLITTNGALARLSRKYDLEHAGPGFRIPAAVTDVFVGTVAWLQDPAQAPSVNQLKMVAECCAGLRPDSALLGKYLREVERLRLRGHISDDEYYILRTHRVAMDMLEEKTLGDPDNFTGQTAEEVLQEIMGRMQRNAEAELRKETEELAATRTELAQARAQTGRLTNNVYARADQLSRAFATGIWTAMIVLFLGGTSVQAIPGLLENTSWLRWILVGLTALLAVLNVATGFNLWGFKDRLRRFAKRAILGYLNVQSSLFMNKLEDNDVISESGYEPTVNKGGS